LYFAKEGAIINPAERSEVDLRKDRLDVMLLFYMFIEVEELLRSLKLSFIPISQVKNLSVLERFKYTNNTDLKKRTVDLLFDEGYW